MNKEFLIPIVTAVTGILAGWLAKRPTSVDKDSSSWTRMNQLVETLQEEMVSSKKEQSTIHQDLEEARQRTFQLSQDLMSTKIELLEIKSLLREAIARLQKNEIDVRGLDRPFL